MTELNRNEGESLGAAKAAGESVSSLSRRHALVKGVGKGAAVLAASVPIRTLATPTTLTYTADGRRCSISGAHSGVHSADTLTGTCGGYSPGYWGQCDNGTTPRRTWPTSHTQLCKNVFTNSQLRNANNTWPTLLQVMSVPRFASSDEFHWVAAWLNALSGSFNFPYSAASVLTFYNAGSASITYKDALAFFKNNLETHVS